jgi:DNA polymerase-3 subunit delta'
MSALAPWSRAVLERAQRAQADGRLGHALLLCGPQHMGKREVADRLAAWLLCRQRAGEDACGRCRSCELLAAGTHPDFLRLGFLPTDKGDKLRTELVVEQVRELSQWCELSAALGGAQVAIVEPADALNAAAANALLKTLEEPVPGRYLLLVSARPGRMPATLRSRCQRYEFRMPERDAALAWLRQQGHAGAAAESALDLAQGQPGLAARWLAEGGIALRDQVAAALEQLAQDRVGPVELAQRWLADDEAGLRLRFAAEHALDRAGALHGLRAAPRGLTVPADFHKLSAWFDAVNRLRDQLRAPLRHDLVLAGLLADWRSLHRGSEGGRT